MRSIFITRQLNNPGPLQLWADEHGYTLTGQSLIRFEEVPFRAPVADWWFFYSPRAVIYGLAGADEAANPPPRLAALGPGTAEQLLNMVGRVDFTGSGKPEEVAAAFAKVAGGQRVFFPRARQSRLTVQTLITDRVTVLDAVCYNNVAEPVSEPINADVMIFTSPLNVAAYLDHQPLGARTRVLAIGNSTAGALRQRGIHCEVAAEPTEAALVEVLGE
jgi:uroporphyrinogen-III synthase